MKNYFKVFCDDRSVTIFLIFLIFIVCFYIVDKETARTLGIFGLSIFFLQESFKYSINKDLEIFKLSLDKNKIAYENTYVKRVSVITDVYAKIVNTEKKFRKLFIDNLSDQERKKGYDEAEKVYLDLKDYYDKNKIFLTEIANNNFKIFFDSLSTILILSFYHERGLPMYDSNLDDTRDSTKEEKDEVRKSNKITMDEKFPLIKSELESVFVEILKLKDN